MKIKLICSDIDGTLLNKDRKLSERTIAAIKNLSDIPFILISSRMPKAMVHLQETLEITHLPLIAFNGGLIIGGGKVIDTTEIDTHVMLAIATFCRQTGLHISLYHNDEWYVPDMDYWASREAHNTRVHPETRDTFTALQLWKKHQKGAHKIMVMGNAEEIDQLENYIAAHLDDVVIGYRSKPEYLEITHRSISKKTALITLLKHYYPHISLNEVMAFGDNYNDVDMIKSVGVGVAVANAKPEVKAVATAVTASNRADGVAIFLEDYFK